MPLVIAKDPTNPKKRIVLLKVEPTKIGSAVPPRVSLSAEVYPEMQYVQDALLGSSEHKRVSLTTKRA